MSLLKQVLENHLTMSPTDWGVGALPKTAKKVAVGDPAGNRPFTTFLLQRTAAEEHEETIDPVIDECLNHMHQGDDDSWPYDFIYDKVMNQEITKEQFLQIMVQFEHQHE